MSKMNPEVKARWVAALRSGEYKQGRGALRRTTGEMCCLGVLCDLLAPERWAAPWDAVINQDCYRQDCYRHNNVIDTPNDEIRAMAGFPRLKPLGGEDAPPIGTPKVNIDGRFDFLWAHNDSGASFEEIADAIEAQL